MFKSLLSFQYILEREKAIGRKLMSQFRASEGRTDELVALNSCFRSSSLCYCSVIPFFFRSTSSPYSLKKTVLAARCDPKLAVEDDTQHNRMDSKYIKKKLLWSHPGRLLFVDKRSKEERGVWKYLCAFQPGRKQMR